MAIADVAPPLNSKRRRVDFSWPVFGALGLALIALVVLPMFWLAAYSVTSKDGGFTLDNFVQLGSDPTLRRPFLIALSMALAVGFLSSLIATPLAWLCARTDLPGQKLVRAGVMASFVTPPFLGAIAWEILAAPNSGLINQAYRGIFGLAPFDDPLVDIYTMTGLVFAISCYTFPYVFTLVANALDRVPSDLEDASAILGGGWWWTLRRVTLPMALPAMLAGSLIAILQALTMFGTPAILAMPAGFHVITTKIWSLFQYPPKPELAAAAAWPLLIFTVMLLWGQRRILGRRGFESAGGKSGEARVVKLGRWRGLAVAFAFTVILFTILLPCLALLKAALMRKVSDPIALSSLTLHNFNFVLFEFSATRLAMWNTFVLGLTTATLGTTLALVVAYLANRNAIKGAWMLGALATTPVAIPGIVLGVGLFISYTRPGLMLYGTLWILLIAFLTIELPAGYQQLSSALKGVHVDLEEASRMLGATRLQTLARINAPLLRTSVIATWCFIFIGTIRELSATILLTTAETKLVSVIIYDLHESGDIGAISVLGLLLLAVTFVVVWGANRLPVLGGQERKRSG
jgi:iron(III) transport system permease protein